MCSTPDEYIRLLDEVNDARLLAEATERMSHFDPSTVISQKEVDQELGFSPADYDDVAEIELE